MAGMRARGRCLAETDSGRGKSDHHRVDLENPLGATHHYHMYIWVSQRMDFIALNQCNQLTTLCFLY